MLKSKWAISTRQDEHQLVLEIPTQVREKLLWLLGPWLLLWPIGALVLPLYLIDWIESRPLGLSLGAFVAIAWMLPWFRLASMLSYLLRGMERITIRPGAVEIERGVGRRVSRERYEGVPASSWRVSPQQHHVYDWHGVMSPGEPGLWRHGGALTFTHGRRAVRCGRNFGTRKARALLQEIQEFLEFARVRVF